MREIVYCLIIFTFLPLYAHSQDSTTVEVTGAGTTAPNGTYTCLNPSSQVCTGGFNNKATYQKDDNPDITIEWNSMNFEWEIIDKGGAIGTQVYYTNNSTKNNKYPAESDWVFSDGIEPAPSLSYGEAGSTPIAFTDAATNISPTGATLNGRVQPEDSAGVYFWIDKDGALSPTEHPNSPFFGTAEQSASFDVSGLSPNTEYRFYVEASNDFGDNSGSLRTFTTRTATPNATTEAATNITQTGVQFNGTVYSGAAATSVQFEYWSSGDQSAAQTVDATQSPIPENTDASVSRTVSGLVPGKSYTFRVIATNSEGSTQGTNHSFQTDSPGYDITKIQPTNGSPNTNIRIYGPEFTGSPSDFEVTFSPAGGLGSTGAVEDSVDDGVIYTKVPSGLSGGNFEIYVEHVDDGSIDAFPHLFSVATSGGSNFSDRMEIDEFDAETGVIYVADLDDDGDLDLSGEEGWYANDGNGNFGDAQSSTTEFDEIRENYADFNGDGLLDYAFYNNTEITWNENNGDGTYTTHVIEELDNNFAPPVITSDINEDGYIDIITYILIEKPSPPHTFGITIFKNNGSGGFNLDGVEDVYIIDADIPDVRDLHAADIDDDGDMDIAVSSSEEGTEPDLAWFENGLTRAASGGVGPIGGTTSKQRSKLQQSNTDTISYGAANSVAGFDDEGSWSVTSADINGDDRLDLIATGHDDGEIAWFENTGGSGSNKFTDKKIITRKALGGLSVETADIDGDGDMDIVAASDYRIGESDRTDILGWYENTPDGPASPVADGASRSISDGAINIKQNDAYEGLSFFTLELWFKTTYSGDNQQGIIEHYTESLPLNNESNDSGWYLLQPFGSDNLSFRIELSPQFLELTTETSIEANQWYHVAMVYEYNTSNPASPYSSLNLYINGKKDNAEATGGGTGNVDNGLYGIVVGELRSAVNSQFQGNIDELRMWSTARTKEEIRNNMFEELNGDEAGLIGYWPMDDGNGRQVADLTSNDNHGTQSGDAQFSSDTSPWGITITGSEGWRTMSSPANNDSYEQILQGLWTQGFSGASSEEGTANVLTWNPGTQSWNPPNDISDVPNAGQGFIVYVYDDQDFNNVDDDFPKPIWTNNPREDGDISPSLTHYNDGDAETNDDGWNLVGNPYGATIEWTPGGGWTKTNLDASMYIWNAEAGSYQSHNGMSGTLANDLIAPWQGFWVKANAANPSLTFTDGVRSSGGVFRKQQQVPQLEFELSGWDHSSSAIVMLNKGAVVEHDRLDAYKLEPLSADYLSLFTQVPDSSGEEGTSLDINALPEVLDTPVTLPLGYRFGPGIQAPASGRDLELGWTLSSLPEDWQFRLTDHQTGREVNMREQSSITFRSTSGARATNAETRDATALGNRGKARKTDSGSEATTATSRSPQLTSPFHQTVTPKVLKTKSERRGSRFSVMIIPGTSVGNESTPELPEEFGLSQNYPNPFNPSTEIRYRLPVTGEVQLQVFNMAGRKVATLVNGRQEAGHHRVTFEAGNLASGIYLYRLKAGNTVITKKLTLIK